MSHSYKIYLTTHSVSSWLNCVGFMRCLKNTNRNACVFNEPVYCSLMEKAGELETGRFSSSLLHSEVYETPMTPVCVCVCVCVCVWMRVWEEQRDPSVWGWYCCIYTWKERCNDRPVTVQIKKSNNATFETREEQSRGDLLFYRSWRDVSIKVFICVLLTQKEQITWKPITPTDTRSNSSD